MSEKYEQEFSAFLKLTIALNKKDIVPILYGSVGLYRVTGIDDEIGDLDIVVPDIYLNEKFPEFLNIMNDAGYHQFQGYPHTFTDNNIQIDIEPQNKLLENIHRDLTELPIAQLEGAKFKELTKKYYLAIYKETLDRWEKKTARVKRKVQALEK